MIGRRPLVLGGLAVAGPPARAAVRVPADRSITFRLVRHGDEIGRHVLTFDEADGALTVRASVDATVTLLSIPIVRYRHRVVETWQEGSLVGLIGETHKNGGREWMNARRTAEGLLVQGSRTPAYVAPPAAAGTTYWNKHVLDGPMISLEDGVLLAPKIAVQRNETIRLASGMSIAADRYSLSGAFDVDLWYDRADAWAGLAVVVADGSTVHYERL
jgi:hypothetical protein